MKKLATLFLLILFSTTITAQIIKGSVKDEKGELLHYVNVGVIGKDIGTVTSASGSFELQVPEGLNQENIRFSMVGYEDLTMTVANLRNTLTKNSILTLKASDTKLTEVVIKSKKRKVKILGNKTRSQGTTLSFQSNTLGNELGTIMKINKLATIKSFSASIASKENYPVKMRLNFYSVKDGLPNKLIIDQSIIVTAPKDNSLLTVDLTQYDIVVTADFFVSLEWIETAPGGLAFSAALFKPLIERKTSQGDWNRASIAGVGFTCKVLY